MIRNGKMIDFGVKTRRPLGAFSDGDVFVRKNFFNLIYTHDSGQYL